jgi:hypothetical protein
VPFYFGRPVGFAQFVSDDPRARKQRESEARAAKRIEVSAATVVFRWLRDEKG